VIGSLQGVRATPKDVMEAAAAYFTPEQRTVVILKGAQQ
jgi:predicted Zn-dependent peptidase